MATACETLHREGRRRLTEVSDEFRVVLCMNETQDLREFSAILRRLGTRFVAASDADRTQDVIAGIGEGLAVFAFGFGGRRAADLIATHRNLNGAVAFAFWSPQEVTDLDDVVAAVQSGAVGVIRGAPSEKKIEELIENSRRQSAAAGDEQANPDERLSWSPAQTAGSKGATGNGHSNGWPSADALEDAADRSSDATPQDGVPDISCSATTRHDTAYVGENGERAQVVRLIRGRSAAIEAIRNTICHLAPTQATVMIFGESGTGKELIARAIHASSRRSKRPFVPVNMSAIPHGLAESFLFGHERGAFTSAIQKQKGWCRVAHEGTLFLDEIGEMELAIQPKLLRFLQEGSIQTVGGQTVEKVDVRLICATNRDPLHLVGDGHLREDLYFRLNVIPIYVPPLRDRREDIEELALLFLKTSAERHERPVRGFTDEAMKALVSHRWPGNVRQLENMVERLVIFAKGEFIEATEIPRELQVPCGHRRYGVLGTTGNENDANGQAAESDADGADAILDHLSPFQLNERLLIVDALERADGHVIRAARLLGLGQATMYRKIKRYAIPRKRKWRKAGPE